MVIATLRCPIKSLLLTTLLIVLPGAAAAQETTQNDGLFVTVPTLITDAAVGEIERKVKDVVERQNRRLHTIVFDFNPGGAPSSSSKAYSCSALADYILKLRFGQAYNGLSIKTMAFVHNEVSRHSVLPVLACGGLVMSDAVDRNTGQTKAKVGDILRDEKAGLPAEIKQTYERVADNHAAKEVVQKMVRQEPGFKMLDALQARKLGLCQAHYNSRADLAAFLKLPRHSLVEDWLEGRVPVAWRIDVRGPLDKARLQSLERRLDAAVARQANFIMLLLDCPEGDPDHTYHLARKLSNLQDDGGKPIRTVAYLPPGTALGAGTFLALGCQEIVMGQDAVLGDFNYLKPDRDLSAARENIVPLAKQQGYPELLFEAMVNPDLVVYHMPLRAQAGRFELVSDKQREADLNSKPQRYTHPGERIDKGQNRLLKLDSTNAKRWRIVLENNVPTPEALYALYNLDSSKVRLSRDDWLDKVAEFFREPIVNVILIMLGIIGLILEMKMPGTTVPGILGAICFVLFFWAYSFVGEFTLLAVLLFALGLILLGVEVFVIPGFGFTGISGILLIVTGLVLVTLDRLPESSSDWYRLGGTLSMFGISLAAAIAGAFMVAWYLPHIPYANRLVLAPPGEENPEAADVAAQGPEMYAALLGAIGVAATPLRPAGKARFGDDFLDVIAEGDYVNPGSRVQVIEIEGNRIVVKEV
jgi:membrane-bound ClpP family serine protease